MFSMNSVRIESTLWSDNLTQRTSLHQSTTLIYVIDGNQVLHTISVTTNIFFYSFYSLQSLNCDFNAERRE
jgi:hypothetical protein